MFQKNTADTRRIPGFEVARVAARKISASIIGWDIKKKKKKKKKEGERR